MEVQERREFVGSTEKKEQKQLVTADGTYATQTALSSAVQAKNDDSKPPLRRFLLEGEYFLGASLSTILNKLAQRNTALNRDNQPRINHFNAEVMFMLASIVHLGKSGISKNNITEDDLDRSLFMNIETSGGGLPAAESIFLEKCKESLEIMLSSKPKEKKEADEKKKNQIEVDKTICFTQLSARAEGITGDNLFDLSLSQALGTAPKTQKFDFSSSKLGKVMQLAGFSDPIYAEAYVNVNQYDIVLDVLIVNVNQTPDTLQNVSLELSTMGDLKLVDKPTPVTLAPQDFTNIKATIKVASAENGVIFSTISYDVRGSTSDRNCVYLQDIKIDIMGYIVPGSVTDAEFRTMWNEFEWENKVTVNTRITNLREFLAHLSAVTNMKLSTSEAALEGDCGFLAANFCAHSIFGEDALANVSVEKGNPLDENSPIIGHIRIRAKSQGMALTLGDKINMAQQDRRKGAPAS